MNALARKQIIQRGSAQPASIPAPVGGWNARDSIANMDPMDAVTLTNFFPTTSSVELRGGSSVWASGMSGQIETLMNYAGGATSKFYAIDATGKKVYDITTAGTVGAAAVSGLTNARWEYANITTAGGNYLEMVNGADKLYLFDGTTWTAIDSGSSPAITGVATTSLSNILLFKNRLWFIQKNTLKAWYLPTSSIGGALSEFDLTAIARRGGYLVDFDTWTLDAGYGVDDYLAFITSNGEVIVYGGTDPASSATWGLIGVWQLGAPIGNRCMLKYGGDLLILTYDGLMPMAQALQSSRLDPRIALSDKIQGAISTATSTYASHFGWQIVYYPKSNAVWVNVPIQEGSQQQQYVMNTITKNWCNFTSWTANCWELFNSTPYFGGASGKVYTAWDSTYSDVGVNINTSALQAFNYFEKRGQEKYFTRARPAIFTNGQPTVSIGLNVDFDIQDNLAPITFTASSSSTWDSAVWDGGMWGQDLTITNFWQSITGIGYCGAIQLKSASAGLQIQWASTDVVYQLGWAGI